MSGRFDAFFSLTLCHCLVVSILFAGALSFYAPLATSYYQLVSLTALLYWLLVLFIITVLTTTVQLVMRMVRVGSGQLLQRYERVGVMLANPPPRVNQDFRRGQPSQNWTYNNRSNSNVTWSDRLRRLTSLSRQNNNNNNNNKDGIAIASTGSVASDAAVRRLSRMTDRFLIFNECSGVFSSLSSHAENISTPGLALPPASTATVAASCSDDVGDAAVEGTLYSFPATLSSTGEYISQEPRQSSAAVYRPRVERCCCVRQPGIASAAECLDAAAQLNVNNNNSDKRDRTSLVSVTVQSSQHPHDENISSNAGHGEENYSSNAGAEDVPRVSRRSSAARASRQASALDDLVGRSSRSSTGQSVAAPRRSSMGQSISQEPRRSSLAGRQSGVEGRRSSAGGELRRDSSHHRMSIADRRSSTGQSLSQEARRSSAAGRQSGVEPRQSSVGQEARRSSSHRSVVNDDTEPRRSSTGQEVRRRSSKGLDISEEAARRSFATGTGADVGGRRSAGELSPEREESTRIAGRYGGSSEYCCEPRPPSACSSCCRPSVRPHTCWCRCDTEIHDPELLGDCCGSRDGRLLSLPGFPRNKPTCNSCFTPCRPLPPICSKVPVCERKCRFSSHHDCGCACPCELQGNCKDECDKTCASEADDDDDGGGQGVVGNLLNKLGLSRSENQTPRGGTANSKPSFASSFKSLFSRRNSSANNMSRNNPALRFASSRHSQLPALGRSSAVRHVDDPSNFNTSTNSSSAAFDAYWSKFWDQIAPHRETDKLPCTFGDIPLTELKTFTGHLIESVIAKLKGEYRQPSTKSAISNCSPGRVTPCCMREKDIEAVCRDILREMMHKATSTRSETRTFTYVYCLIK